MEVVRPAVAGVKEEEVSDPEEGVMDWVGATQETMRFVRLAFGPAFLQPVFLGATARYVQPSV
eukprot:6199122-Pleurochrysis_carterae.AAC.2